MKAPARLGLYGLALVTVFAVAGFTANAVVPEEIVQNWTHEAVENHHVEPDDMTSDDAHSGHDASPASLGLGVAQDGYQLTSVTAPTTVGDRGELSLVVTDPSGKPVTDFESEDEKELNLIAVRADGRYFRHIHPARTDDGTWSIPWEWEAAGAYRVLADFVPTETGSGLTLSTSVQVAGDYTPEPAIGPATESRVNGYTISVTGDLVAGETSKLTMIISRDGKPVTQLQPYLGALGHLVVLRDGDLAYLHVHPHSDALRADETSGPQMVFETTVPTPGRYLLYLDFQVDGQVHTARLVLDTATGNRGGDHGGGNAEDSHKHE